MNQQTQGATGSNQRDKKMLLSGVLILTISNLLVKICGFIF